MPKMMLHDDEARAALGRGVTKLARAVRGTLGPRGMNAIIDRPIGTPLISRDGVSIAAEIELPDRFENMGAQVLREVSMQTNAVAGDGTTTATVLADALVQRGLAALAGGAANAVELVAGLEAASETVIAALRASARPLRDDAELRAVATIAAGEAATGGLIAETLIRVGTNGIVTVENSPTVETWLDVAEGMSFDRGYISHHMVTDIERMQAVLDDPLILMTDLKLQTAEDVATILAFANSRPLLIIAEELAPGAVMALLDGRDGAPRAAIHPPEYGNWRKSTLEDIAIATGGRVISRELGGRIDRLTRDDLGSARQVRIGADMTMIAGGGGDQAAIAARREQVQRQIGHAPNNIDRDKLEQRLARLSGGTATIHAGGVTPVAQKRHAQLIEDALAAARAAMAEGVVAGGGTALAQIAPMLGSADTRDTGAALLREALTAPLAAIASNAGLDASGMVAKVLAAPKGTGLDARSGRLVAMEEAGIIDPLLVGVSAIRNAVSVASLILTTDTLIADAPDYTDPTAGAALGGGAERL